MHLGILNPAFFGTTHTGLVAIVVEHVSSHDVMGFEGLRSKVQSNRLEHPSVLIPYVMSFPV